MENVRNPSKEAQAKRLKLARKERFETATEAAEALGLNKQTYMPWGERPNRIYAPRRTAGRFLRGQ